MQKRSNYINNYLPAAGGDGVAAVDGRDGFHQEGDDQVGEAEVEQQQVCRRAHQLIVVPYSCNDQQVH